MAGLRRRHHRHGSTLQCDLADVFSWNNRGREKSRLEDDPRAIADFKKALELRTDLVTAQDSPRKLCAAKVLATQGAR
jgi:hypothetical protein